MILATLLLITATSNFIKTGEFQVLSYATDTTVSGLFTETNRERAAAGLSTFTIDSLLNTAAQNKANHMIANDYWSHVAPDGTTPWDFIDNVGYVYLKAGENLAYGYQTSAGVVDAWMNSEGHRENILDEEFQEVGFGIASGEDFQGGENTVVVAMYALPYDLPVVVNDTDTTPPSDEPAAIVQEVEETATAEVEPVEDTSQSLTVYRNDGSAEPISITTGKVASDEVTGEVVTNFEALLRGKAPISMYLTVGILLLIGFIYALRHVKAVHQFILVGEHTMEGHPLLEAGIIYALIWLVLSATYGVII